MKNLQNPQFEFKYTREYARIPQTKAMIPTYNTPKYEGKNFIFKTTKTPIYHLLKHLKLFHIKNSYQSTIPKSQGCEKYGCMHCDQA